MKTFDAPPQMTLSLLTILFPAIQVEASHKTSLEKLPQVLILHLKYFVYDKAGGCQKTHKHVEISRELEIPKGNILFFVVRLIYVKLF